MSLLFDVSWMVDLFVNFLLPLDKSSSITVLFLDLSISDSENSIGLPWLFVNLLEFSLRSWLMFDYFEFLIGVLSILKLISSFV